MDGRPGFPGGRGAAAWTHPARVAALALALWLAAAAAPVPGGAAPLAPEAPGASGGGPGSLEVRVKDLVRVVGARYNQLTGLGLVVGLRGTGDSRSAATNLRMVANMLERFGITISEHDLRVRNVAAVTVTADLPPFARAGDRIDVTVSSIGDARSLAGGLLLQTPLVAANGEVYAVAQGPVIAGREALRRDLHGTVGRIPGGALVEREVQATLAHDGLVELVLREPDFTTAARVARALDDTFGPGTAEALDAATVAVLLPPAYRGAPVEFLARLAEVTVTPDAPARVVVNERTGTVVIGDRVRILPVEVAHGDLRVEIGADGLELGTAPAALRIAPPGLRGSGVREGALFQLGGSATVRALVDALNAVGATPTDIIAILQAIQAAGALYAEVEVL